MNLYLLRHAIALERTEWHRADSDRPLTEDGIRKMKTLAKGMDRLNLKIDQILTSPYRRAYETAVIAAKALKLTNVVRVSKLLTPEGDPKALVRRLALDFRSWETVLLVGHEPYLSRLMSVLTGGNTDFSLILRKGGLAKLSCDSFTFGKCATLEWLLTPKILKKLA
jgi:phosphohistidine phosphatase